MPCQFVRFLRLAIIVLLAATSTPWPVVASGSFSAPLMGFRTQAIPAPVLLVGRGFQVRWLRVGKFLKRPLLKRRKKTIFLVDDNRHPFERVRRELSSFRSSLTPAIATVFEKRRSGHLLHLFDLFLIADQFEHQMVLIDPLLEKLTPIWDKLRGSVAVPIEKISRTISTSLRARNGTVLIPNVPRQGDIDRGLSPDIVWTVADHVALTAFVALYLASLLQATESDTQLAAAGALFHDATEIITKDMTPMSHPWFWKYDKRPKQLLEWALTPLVDRQLSPVVFDEISPRAFWKIVRRAAKRHSLVREILEDSDKIAGVFQLLLMGERHPAQRDEFLEIDASSPLFNQWRYSQRHVMTVPGQALFKELDTVRRNLIASWSEDSVHGLGLTSERTSAIVPRLRAARFLGNGQERGREFREQLEMIKAMHRQVASYLRMLFGGKLRTYDAAAFENGPMKDYQEIRDHFFRVGDDLYVHLHIMNGPKNQSRFYRNGWVARILSFDDRHVVLGPLFVERFAGRFLMPLDVDRLGSGSVFLGALVEEAQDVIQKEWVEMIPLLNAGWRGNYTLIPVVNSKGKFWAYRMDSLSKDTIATAA